MITQFETSAHQKDQERLDKREAQLKANPKVHKKSWTDMHHDVWMMLLEMGYLPKKIFPPPIEIIHEDVGDFLDGEQRIHYLNGEMHTIWTGRSERQTALPVQYELRIYHDSTVALLNEMCGDWVPEGLLVITMIHAILHESIHFIRNYKKWLHLVEHNTSENYHDMLDYLNCTGQYSEIRDEYETETQTMQWLFNILARMNFENLIPVYNGQYDLMMRRIDERWKETMDYYEIMRLSNLWYLSKGRASDKQMMSAFHQITKIVTQNQKKMKNPYLFEIID